VGEEDQGLEGDLVQEADQVQEPGQALVQEEDLQLKPDQKQDQEKRQVLVPGKVLEENQGLGVDQVQ